MFKNFKIRLLTIITLLFTCSILRGTHIVGGDITYKFVHKSNGNITYHFTLKVYRDLFGENPSISLDDYASISIYSKNETDNTYTLYGDKGNNKPLQIPLKANPTSVTLPQYPCFKPPNNIGVEVGFYEWDATLEESNTSYIIAYQRCCRNVTISNIDVKNRIGSTYFIEITPESQKLSNSSPEFTTLPPLLICGGEPLNYNHVATDIDGDQLVYTFCSPLLGGSDKDAKPEQPAAPPYQYATFIQPKCRVQ